MMSMKMIAKALFLTCGAALAVASAGCSSKPDDAAKFIGTWRLSTGSLMATCPLPIGPVTQDLSGAVLTIDKGTTSALRTTLDTCTVTFKVDGSQATADPANQTCSFNVPPIGGVSVTITTWTLDETGDTLTANMTGSALASCPVTATGVAMRSTDASTGG